MAGTLKGAGEIETESLEIVGAAISPNKVTVGTAAGLESTHLPVAEEEHRREMERLKRIHEYNLEVIHAWFARIVASISVVVALFFAIHSPSATSPSGIVNTVLGAAVAYLFAKKG
jgi:hypothetical protein